MAILRSGHNAGKTKANTKPFKGAEVIIAHTPSTLYVCETHVEASREVYCPPNPSDLLIYLLSYRIISSSKHEISAGTLRNDLRSSHSIEGNTISLNRIHRFSESNLPGFSQIILAIEGRKLPPVPLCQQTSTASPSSPT